MNEGIELQHFTFPTTGHEVRSFHFSDESWFVAADVCAALEIGNPSQAVARLDDDEKAQVSPNLISNEVGGRDPWVVNEPGLYSLILGSRKPEAKAFKRWVTHEVLPAIRQTGSYSVAKPASALEALAQTVALLLEQERRATALEGRAAVLEAKVEAIEGKHDWFSCLGFARLQGLPTEQTYLLRVGLKASNLMKKDGLKPVPVQNAVYGKVNTYPVTYLERAFAAVAP